MHIIEVYPSEHHATLWSDEENGIRDQKAFVEHYSKDHAKKMHAIVSVVFNECWYLMQTGYKRMQTRYSGTGFAKFDDNTAIGAPHSKGLIVFFHGLNGQPSVWDEHKNDVMQQAPEIDVLAPEVPRGGHCELNGMESQTLCMSIVAWTKEHPQQPVALFGQSNGTRFALRMETWLRKQAPETPVHVSLSGGVLYGSSRVETFTKWIAKEKIQWWTRGILQPVSCDELSYGNATAKKLLQEARQPLDANVASRDYVMYASLYDAYVPDTGSSLPVINMGGRQERKTEKHYFVAGAGHNSIVCAVRQVQISNCLQWMKQWEK